MRRDCFWTPFSWLTAPQVGNGDVSSECREGRSTGWEMRLVLLPELDPGAIICYGPALEPSGKGWLNISTTFSWCMHPDSLVNGEPKS